MSQMSQIYEKQTPPLNVPLLPILVLPKFVCYPILKTYLITTILYIHFIIRTI